MSRKQQWNIEVDDQLYKQLEEYLRDHPLEVRSRLIREVVREFLRNHLPKKPLKSSSWQHSVSMDHYPETHLPLEWEEG